MRNRWIGITGLALLVTSLLLGAFGPRLWPQAFGNAARAGMMNNGMMSSMMSSGMMNNMMGSDMMGPGMMGGRLPDDPSQPYDQRFLDQMIPHHQSGIMMTQHMIVESQRPELRDLAQRIIAAQQREIDQMREWRREWYSAPAATNSREAMMEQMQGQGMMNGDHMRQMMGQNVDRDQMFLQMMIPHHQGAIEMAQQALEQAEHPEIKTLAQNIITTQQAEIEEMQGYLRDWYGGQ